MAFLYDNPAFLGLDGGASGGGVPSVEREGFLGSLTPPPPPPGPSQVRGNRPSNAPPTNYQSFINSLLPPRAPATTETAPPWQGGAGPTAGAPPWQGAPAPAPAPRPAPAPAPRPAPAPAPAPAMPQTPTYTQTPFTPGVRPPANSGARPGGFSRTMTNTPSAGILGGIRPTRGS